MKIQWSLIWGLLFALLVALFAVFNVNNVSINYLFGQTEIPLIIVIIGSALLGGLVVGLFGIVRQYKLQWEIKKLKKELAKVAVPAPVFVPENGAKVAAVHEDNCYEQHSDKEDSGSEDLAIGNEASDRNK